MNRRRRFPLLSLLVLFALGFALFQICKADQNTPQRAISQIRMACGQIINSFRMLGGATGATSATGAAAETEFAFADAPSVDAAFVDASAWEEEVSVLPMLVSEANPLPEGYAPKNLVRMRDYCDRDVVYIVGSEIDGEKEAVDALMIMLRAAIADGMKNWQINAGYRSIAYQQRLWDDRVYKYRQQGYTSSQAKEATAKFVAKPGSSEHHTGLAFDVTVPGEAFATTKQSKWLSEHCYEYGFVIRYTEEKAHITGFQAEPWHIRYVGQPHARIMRENGWCLEEYLEGR